MRKFSLTLFLICFSMLAFSQKEWSNWYGNGRELLTFKNGFAEKVDSFIDPIPTVPPFSNLFHFYHWGSGGISYSDPATGDVKFIISQRVGYGRDFKDFPNDTFLKSCPDEKSYHIIPFSNDTNKFYVIQFQSCFADLLAGETGLQVRCPNAIGLGYSIVDMSLNGGLGDFSSVNNSIAGPFTEQITTIRHANGKDVWIVVHPYNSAKYEAILVTASGIQPGVFSTIGGAVNGGSATVEGELAATHDGKLIAGCRSFSSGTGSESNIELFDFDNATGLLSNYRQLPNTGHTIKLEFSPDNSKLYALGFNDSYSNCIITQWDFNHTNIASSKTAVYDEPAGNTRDMRLAPDGKIYISGYQEYTDDYHTYLIAIQCPNLPQYACNINKRAIELSYAAFPALINDFINVPRVAPTPQFSLGNDTAVCFGSLTLTAPAGWQSYKWNTGDSTQSVTVTKAGLYYVLTGSLGFSCPSGYGYINVSDKAIKLNLGKDTALCEKTSYQLHVPNNYTNILWNNGSNTRDSVLYGGGNIIISANDMNGCYTNDTINVYYKYYPRADFGNDTTLCNNEILKLQLLPPKSSFWDATYLWQNNSVLDTFTISQQGSYWGSVTYNGCTVRDTINVSYVNGENVTLGNDTTLCAGDSLLLTSSIPLAQYRWSTGDTTQFIYVKNTGNYWIRVTNGACTVMDTIHVIFNTKPSFSLGNDTSLCKKELLTLTPAAGSGTYLWQDGSAQQQYTVSTDGLYWLNFTRNGCSVTDSINVFFKDLPPVNLGNDSAFCIGTTIKLNAYNQLIQSYLWQDLSVASLYMAGTGGQYSVTVTGINGCKNYDTITLHTVPLPVFNLGNDTALCIGETVAYNFSIPGATYSWNDGAATGQYTINHGGLYWLRINESGCTKTDSITVNYKPLPVVNLGNDTTLCEGTGVVLTASNNNAVYQWNDGTTVSTLNVNKAGLYFVTANMAGCITKDSIYITYIPAPLFTLGNDTFICKGQEILLQPYLNTPVSYTWQNGSKASFFSITDTGKYVLTVSNECGFATRSIMVSRGVCQLYLPSAFSPNGDRLNDLFRIKYPFVVQQFNMVVYNRYGQKIFETNDINKGWDGSYNGAEQPAGAYIWIISMTDIDGRKKNINGSVLLVR